MMPYAKAADLEKALEQLREYQTFGKDIPRIYKLLKAWSDGLPTSGSITRGDVLSAIQGVMIKAPSDARDFEGWSIHEMASSISPIAKLIELAKRGDAHGIVVLGKRDDVLDSLDGLRDCVMNDTISSLLKEGCDLKEARFSRCVSDLEKDLAALKQVLFSTGAESETRGRLTPEDFDGCFSTPADVSEQSASPETFLLKVAHALIWCKNVEERLTMIEL